MFNIQRIVFFFYVTGGKLGRRTYDLFGWSSTKLLRLVVGREFMKFCMFTCTCALSLVVNSRR